MKTIPLNKFRYLLFTGIALLLFWGCSRSVDNLDDAPASNEPDIFIDTFSQGLDYAAFEGSVLEAFEVVTDVTYDNSEASMRFEVPDFGDPRGSYAGGTFFTNSPRDLSEYNAITFYARASKSTTIDVLGFGIDLDQNKFATSVNAIPVTSSWRKQIIPLPDPSKLTFEKGLFFYSSGPQNGEGYTFWLDEVKFENLGTIIFESAQIMNGEDVEVAAQNGQTVLLSGLISIHNMPDGTSRSVNASPYFYTFSSSDNSVAEVSEDGRVTILSEGTAVITATFRGSSAAGSLTVISEGDLNQPSTLPDAPTQSPIDVISLYTDIYDNVSVDTWNTRWEGSTAEEFFIQIQGQDVIRYQNLNFVGIEFTSQTINASEMTHFSLDIWTPDETVLPNVFKVKLVDFGSDNQFGGGDDSEHEVTFTSPKLETENWVRLDIPLSQFTGLQNRANLSQLILSGDLSNVYVTNVYFFRDEEGTTPPEEDAEPSSSAPTPTENPADVISLFSDAYTDVGVDTWRTDWSSAIYEETTIHGSATKKYSSLDFVGIETTDENLIDASEMDYFHIDVWTPNMDVIRIKLVDFGPNGQFNGGDDSEHEILFDSLAKEQWHSLQIPMADFTGLQNQASMAQYILSGLPTGAGTLYIDNVYFSKNTE